MFVACTVLVGWRVVELSVVWKSTKARAFPDFRSTISGQDCKIVKAGDGAVQLSTDGETSKLSIYHLLIKTICLISFDIM
jgi:hypothetical protein